MMDNGYKVAETLFGSRIVDTTDATLSRNMIHQALANRETNNISELELLAEGAAGAFLIDGNSTICTSLSQIMEFVGRQVDRYRCTSVVWDATTLDRIRLGIRLANICLLFATATSLKGLIESFKCWMGKIESLRSKLSNDTQPMFEFSDGTPGSPGSSSCSTTNENERYVAGANLTRCCEGDTIECEECERIAHAIREQQLEFRLLASKLQLPAYQTAEDWSEAMRQLCGAFQQQLEFRLLALKLQLQLPAYQAAEDWRKAMRQVCGAFPNCEPMSSALKYLSEGKIVQGHLDTNAPQEAETSLRNLEEKIISHESIYDMITVKQRIGLQSQESLQEESSPSEPSNKKRKSNTCNYYNYKYSYYYYLRLLLYPIELLRTAKISTTDPNSCYHAREVPFTIPSVILLLQLCSLALANNYHDVARCIRPSAQSGGSDPLLSTHKHHYHRRFGDAPKRSKVQTLEAQRHWATILVEIGRWFEIGCSSNNFSKPNTTVYIQYHLVVAQFLGTCHIYWRNQLEIALALTELIPADLRGCVVQDMQRKTVEEFDVSTKMCDQGYYNLFKLWKQRVEEQHFTVASPQNEKQDNNQTKYTQCSFSENGQLTVETSQYDGNDAVQTPKPKKSKR